MPMTYVNRYITKYWETRGIYQAMGCFEDTDEGYYFYADGWRSIPSSHVFEDEEEARRSVVKRAKKRVAKLQAKIDQITKDFLNDPPAN